MDTATKKVQVTGSEGLIQFEADGFATEGGYLVITQSHQTIALFAPGHWFSVNRVREEPDDHIQRAVG